MFKQQPIECNSVEHINGKLSAINWYLKPYILLF